MKPSHHQQPARQRRPNHGPASPAPNPALITRLEAENQDLRAQLELERADYEANQEAFIDAQRELEFSRDRFLNSRASRLRQCVQVFDERGRCPVDPRDIGITGFNDVILVRSMSA